MSEVKPSRLTFVSEGSNYRRQIFRCECGVVKEMDKYSVRRGGTVSCGCYGKEKQTTHGLANTPLYKLWLSINSRCTNKKRKGYERYGGRGITVCQRWREDATAFIHDVEPRPDGMEIDRPNNSGGYWCGKVECPECGPIGREPNWRWLSHQGNARNRRSNRKITWNGETKIFIEWAELAGITFMELVCKIKYGGVEKTFTELFSASKETT